MAPALEVADIFRRPGEAFRQAHAGHIGGVERRIMGAITACRTAVLGGHVEQCDDCGATRIAYNSCRNRHCPKCQGLARAQWLAERQAELLPVPYFHVVFTLPAAVGEIAFQNKAVVYAILFRAAAETFATIAADPRHLDYRAGGKTKVMTLDANEFIRRFLLHTLPDSFHRIRHYGFLANGARGDCLALCHRLLDAGDTGACEPANNRAKGERPLTTADFAICPDCGGTMRRIAIVPRSCNPLPFSCDTS